MTIMSSFRLKTYVNGSFQLSVSIWTNILAIFFQHLLKIRMIPSPVKDKQTKTTQQQIQSHLKKVGVSRFPVVSNEETQELNSVAVNKQSKYALLHKTVNERTSYEAGASTAILRISWNKWRRKNLTRPWVLSPTPRSQKETEMIMSWNPFKWCH